MALDACPPFPSRFLRWWPIQIPGLRDRTRARLGRVRHGLCASRHPHQFEKSGHIVEKKELLERVWPGVVRSQQKTSSALLDEHSNSSGCLNPPVGRHQFLKLDCSELELAFSIRCVSLPFPTRIPK